MLFMLAAGATTAHAVAPPLESAVTDYSLSSKPKKPPKNDSNCVANENLGETADKYISRCRRGGIRQEFPSELLQSTLGDIKGGSSAVQKKGWKLLNDNRFEK